MSTEAAVDYELQEAAALLLGHDPDQLAEGGGPDAEAGSTVPSKKVLDRIRKLYAKLDDSDSNTAEIARTKLEKLMSEHGLKWRDLPEIVRRRRAHQNAGSSANSTSQSAGPQVNVLDLTLRLLGLHVRLAEEQRMAVALWILHSHVYDRFPVSPRLVLTSPVRGCGKTTLLILLEMLTARPLRTDNVTAAAIYHCLSLMARTLLIDEGDNLGLFKNGILRSVFNSGHRHGGSVTRYLGGRATRLATFSPLAVAAIGFCPCRSCTALSSSTCIVVRRVTRPSRS